MGTNLVTLQRIYMNNVRQNSVLIALGDPRHPEVTEEHLEELAFLAETAGMMTRKKIIQNLDKPEPRTFIGKGKLQQLKEYVFSDKIRNVIFDDDLSPSQLRNLETELNPKDREEAVKIYDRSLLILDIFLNRAKTAQARTQVELARNQYLLPRLTRLWTHLERQRGGTGTRGGAGEREIETDRRNIRYRIKLLKEELKKIDQQRQTQRKSRGNIVRVALVGYTNAGKSTLMNKLSGSGVLAENKLFATVDATVRKVTFGNIPFLLSDTVGFIRKLPHHLIESFKSTLDEVREANLLLHVVDVAHPFHDNHIEVVTQTLAEIGAAEIPVVLVLNKVDLLRARNMEEPLDLEAMKRYYNELGFAQVIFVSAETGENMLELRKLLFDEVKKEHLKIFPNFLKDGYVFAPFRTEEV
jgi:GTPase